MSKASRPSLVGVLGYRDSMSNVNQSILVSKDSVVKFLTRVGEFTTCRGCEKRSGYSLEWKHLTCFQT